MSVAIAFRLLRASLLHASISLPALVFAAGVYIFHAGLSRVFA